LRELVKDREEGIFVPVGDTEAISNTIIELLLDKPLRKQLQSNGVALIRNRADKKAIMMRMESRYHQLLSA